jgi:type IV pilus assembly protein PilC
MSAAYNYEAFSRNGDEVKGQIEAENESEVRTILGQQNLLVMSVSKVGGDSFASKDINLRKKANVKEIAWLARSLATTQQSGLPVYPALAILARQRAKQPIGKILTRVHTKVGDGSSLTNAFRDESDKVGDLTCALIEAGEISGRLDESLAHLATITESRVRIKRKIRSAMMYPIVVLVIALGMAAALLIGIVPQFEDIYAQLGGELPLPTKIVIAISNAMINFWFLYPIILAAIVGIVVQFQRSEAWKMKLHYWMLKMPVFGPIIHKAAFARFTLVLSSLMNSGVGLLEALLLSGNASGNLYVGKAVERIHDKVREGSSLAAAMKAEEIVPEVMTELVAMGEETGTVPSLLDRYGKTLDDEVTTAVDGLTSLMEPILIVFLGGIIGGLVVAFWLPILNAPKLLESQG